MKLICTEDACPYTGNALCCYSCERRGNCTEECGHIRDTCGCCIESEDEQMEKPNIDTALQEHKEWIDRMSTDAYAQAKNSYGDSRVKYEAWGEAFETALNHLNDLTEF